MENINTYLESRRGKRITVFDPFNDVDAMILARFSYLPFHRIKVEKKETVSSICAKMIDKLTIDDFMWPDDFRYVRLMILSKRFSNMKVTNYVRNNSKSAERQFSAVTIHINHFEMYLSFFGTDDTLVGWKEDFNLAFLDVIPAQKEGTKYVEMIHELYPTKIMRLGGHSKGGNIAMYAAITSPDAYQRKMFRIYNFDGPGLRKGTAALDVGTEKVLRKIRSFIPQGSIIGRLFEHKEKVYVVKSIGKNIYQHDIYTWMIDGKKIVPSSTTKASDLADRTITKWLESASKEERKVFINSLFKVFSSANVNTPLELKAHWLKATPTMLKTFYSLPKEKKKVIFEVWKKLGSSFLKARKENDAN